MEFPAALQAIFVSAFSKKAVIGGIAGTAVKMAVRTGMAKGLFYKRGWNGLDADDGGSGGRAICAGSRGWFR